MKKTTTTQEPTLTTTESESGVQRRGNFVMSH